MFELLILPGSDGGARPWRPARVGRESAFVNITTIALLVRLGKFSNKPHSSASGQEGTARRERVKCRGKAKRRHDDPALAFEQWSVDFSERPIQEKRRRRPALYTHPRAFRSADFPVCGVADFQSASAGKFARLADWKSATQQVGNLRYFRLTPNPARMRPHNPVDAFGSLST